MKGGARSLWWKLLAAILPVVIVVVSLIVVFQYALAKRQILLSIQRELNLLSQRTASSIDAMLRQRRNDLDTLSESPLIVDYHQNVEFGLLAEAESDRQALCGYLLGFSRRTGNYAEILYLDAAGRPVCRVRREALAPASSRRTGADDYLREARAKRRGESWTSVTWDRQEGGPSLHYAKPVHDKLGEFKGALVLAYDLGQVARILEEIGRGGRSVAYLEGPDGRFPEAVETPNGPVVSARTALANQPWALVVEAPLDAYLGPLRHIRAAGLAMALAGLAVLCGTIWVVVRSLTRPIGRLVAAARRIGSGELAYRIDGVGDELGAVATAFNEMAERLEANRKLNLDLQSQLIQAEKLSALGTLISAVAHELNNPLSIILGAAQMSQREALADRVRHDLESIVSNVERARKVVQNLLFFGRQSKQERKRLDVNEAVRSTVDLLRYRLKKTDHVTLEQLPSPDLPAITGDYQQVVQVLFNLVNNACDAMEGRRDKRLTIRTGLCEGGVFVEVEDTGGGIPADVRGKVFEPFFTTKEAGQGTGLGLAICRQIVEQHRGRLSFSTEEGRGTRFRVMLPAAGEAAFQEEHFPAEALPVPGKRILVVDDEKELAELMARLLRVDGDDVAVVHHGSEALRLIRETAFDLVVSDIEMEETKGQQIFEELAKKAPDPARKILFVTGDLLNPRVLRFLSSNQCAFVAKPFDADELRQAVRKMLRGLPVRQDE